MWTDERIEELEAYAQRRMSGTERDAFEQRLRTDAALAEELERYCATLQAIAQHHEDDRVRQLLKRTEARSGSGGNSWWKWAAAAMVILGLSAAWFMARAPSLTALAEEFDVQESPLPVFMSAAPDAQRALDRSMQHFAEGEYTQALEQLELLPRTDTISFYAAICKEQLGMDPSSLLQQVIDERNSQLRAKALYHLMLWHMKLGRRAEALALLQEQRRLKEHPYRTQLEAIATHLGSTP